MFPDLQFGLQAEEAVKAARATSVPATAYYQWKELADRDIVSDIKSGRGLANLNDIQEQADQAHGHSQYLEEQSVSDDLSHLSLDVDTTGADSGMVRPNVPGRECLLFCCFRDILILTVENSSLSIFFS